MKNLLLDTTQTGVWFKDWFDSSHYHNLYQNRNHAEAQGFIDNIVDYLQCTPASSMVDIGCGTGRHAAYLHSKGFSVDAFDLSKNSIREAQRNENKHLRFTVRDMRLPFGMQRYDYVFNFFTSFGYFDDAGDNSRVIANMASALKSAGKIVIDYMNAESAAKNLVPQEIKTVNGTTYAIKRWLDQQFIYKTISYHAEPHGVMMSHTEKVARLGLHDFIALFESNGLKLEKTFGDYALNSFDPFNSPRLIMVARVK